MDGEKSTFAPVCSFHRHVRGIPIAAPADARSSAVGKPATLETGLVVQVPPFVNEGDKIKVDTTEARYVQRVE